METAPKIKSITARDKFILCVVFSDGAMKLYNCLPLLSREMFKQLRDPAFFKLVRVDPGGYGVSWNDEIDISEYELWTNGTPVPNC
jgi:hypothetical protein